VDVPRRAGTFALRFTQAAKSRELVQRLIESDHVLETDDGPTILPIVVVDASAQELPITFGVMAHVQDRHATQANVVTDVDREIFGFAETKLHDLQESTFGGLGRGACRLPAGGDQAVILWTRPRFDLG
jgi:hypothetical protein